MPAAPTRRPGVNVANSLRHAASSRATATAVVDGDTRYDYATLERRAAGLGAGLLGLGLTEGDVVGVLAVNSHRHFECWLGVPRVGLVLNELNTRLAVAELAFIIADCDTRVLIVDDHFEEVGRQLLETCPSLTHLVHASTTAADDLVAFEELVSSSPAPIAETHADTVAAIFYTGGTTGLPKGVVLTHGNLIANTMAIIAGLGYTNADRYLHAAPMFHVADGLSTFAITWVGGVHVFVPGFSPAAVAEVIETERITALVLVATMINMLISDPAVADRDLSSLRCVFYGGSPMPVALQRRASERLACEMVQMYGMTEVPGGTICRLEGPVDEEPWTTRSRSAGIPFIGMQITVRRPDGSYADTDEVGEIWLRGQNVMAGYWGRPEESAAALTADGWYRSADAGRLDADGYLYVVDRLKDMIITGGENVYCAEVESALSTHPSVLEAAVFAVPDDRWVERVHAVVVVRDPAVVSEGDLVEHCRAAIAGYKVPRSIEIQVDPLPKSGAGKVLKRELRAPHWAAIDGET